jgi:hypothetical protein
MVNAGNFDVCILGSTTSAIDFKGGIHVWIRSSDYENSHLMILLSFIIQGHPDWRRSEIRIFDVCSDSREPETRQNLEQLVKEGRLPITTKNIQVLCEEGSHAVQNLIREHSSGAGLCIVGYHAGILKHKGARVFEGFDGTGDILFVNSHSQKDID